MDISFYTGAAGADACIRKLDVIADNLANINNRSYKPGTAVFSEMVGYRLKGDQENGQDRMQSTAAVVSGTGRNFRAGALQQTGAETDYALTEEYSFFQLEDPATGERSYTRDGHFHRGSVGDSFYLLTDSGKYVLDSAGNPLKAVLPEQEKLTEDSVRRNALQETEAADTTDTSGNEDLSAQNGMEQDIFSPGVYRIPYPSRLISRGNNEFTIRPGDTANAAAAAEGRKPLQGMLESSGTDLAQEMTRMMEAQQALNYALKMVQTSDETEAVINQLRS